MPVTAVSLVAVVVRAVTPTIPHVLRVGAPCQVTLSVIPSISVYMSNQRQIFGVGNKRFRYEPVNIMALSCTRFRIKRDDVVPSVPSRFEFLTLPNVPYPTRFVYTISTFVPFNISDHSGTNPSREPLFPVGTLLHLSQPRKTPERRREPRIVRSPVRPLQQRREWCR